MEHSNKPYEAFKYSSQMHHRNKIHFQSGIKGKESLINVKLADEISRRQLDIKMKIKIKRGDAFCNQLHFDQTTNSAQVFCIDSFIKFQWKPFETNCFFEENELSYIRNKIDFLNDKSKKESDFSEKEVVIESTLFDKLIGVNLSIKSLLEQKDRIEGLNWKSYDKIGTYDNIKMNWFFINRRDFCSKTIQEIKKLYQEENFPDTITYSRVRFILHNMLSMKYQKVQVKSSFLVTNDFRDHMMVYIKRFISLLMADLTPIYLDETYYRRVSGRMKAWRFKSDGNVLNASIKQETCTVTLAVTDNIIASCEVNPNINTADHFLSFLERLRVSLPTKSFKSYFLVIDNSRLHKTANIITYFFKNNCNVLYSVKYYCSLNMVEYVFSILKRRFYRSYMDNLLHLNLEMK